MSHYLGIDIGTSATKTIVITAEGEILAQASASYPLFHPKPLWSEQNPEDWWQAVVKTIRAVIKKAQLKPADVRGIGLSGQMHGSVFLDKNHQVIRPALLWNDQRTAAECDEITKLAGGKKSLIKMVANPALTGFTAPKILWLRNNEPKNFEKTVKVLLPKDEIRRRLTGEFVSDLSDASGTLLLDVVKRRWSKPLLRKLDLPLDLLPEVVESEEVTGTLTKNAAKLLGLTTDCLVVGGAGDCAAGAIGNGIVQTGRILASVGTSGVMFAYSKTPQFDPTGRVHTFCHAVKGAWHTMGVTLTAGGALQWFRDQVLENKASSQEENLDFEKLSAEAAALPVGAEGLYFLPYLAGERTPHADPDARGAFVGLTLKHTRGHMVRAIQEGVSFALRDSLTVMSEMGIPINQIRLTGGGSKSAHWRQILASTFGKKVFTMQADEGPAFGVALLAAVGAGEYKSITEACRQRVKTATETKPLAPAKRYYDSSFVRYQSLYSSLKEEFKAISNEQ